MTFLNEAPFLRLPLLGGRWGKGKWRIARGRVPGKTSVFVRESNWPMRGAPCGRWSKPEVGEKKLLHVVEALPGDCPRAYSMAQPPRSFKIHPLLWILSKKQRRFDSQYKGPEPVGPVWFEPRRKIPWLSGPCLIDNAKARDPWPSRTCLANYILGEYDFAWPEIIRWKREISWPLGPWLIRIKDGRSMTTGACLIETEGGEKLRPYCSRSRSENSLIVGIRLDKNWNREIRNNFDILGPSAPVQAYWTISERLIYVVSSIISENYRSAGVRCSIACRRLKEEWLAIDEIILVPVESFIQSKNAGLSAIKRSASWEFAGAKPWTVWSSLLNWFACLREVLLHQLLVLLKGNFRLDRQFTNNYSADCRCNKIFGKSPHSCAAKVLILINISKVSN